MYSYSPITSSLNFPSHSWNLFFEGSSFWDPCDHGSSVSGTEDFASKAGDSWPASCQWLGWADRGFAPQLWLEPAAELQELGEERQRRVQ